MYNLTPWGHLKIVSQGSDSIKKRRLDGSLYDTGEVTPKWLDLLCECGFKFRIIESEFPGRRKLRSCADWVPERASICPFTRTAKPVRNESPGRPLLEAEKGVQQTIYMPRDLIESLVASVRRGDDPSVSRAAVRLMRLGLKNTSEEPQ
jgi:hypothetical protein